MGGCSETVWFKSIKLTGILSLAFKDCEVTNKYIPIYLKNLFNHS